MTTEQEAYLWLAAGVGLIVLAALFYVILEHSYKVRMEAIEDNTRAVYRGEI
jgi:heme exporter protein D